MEPQIGRRDFLKTAAPVNVGVAAAASALTAKPLDEVRVGFIGVGERGSAILRQLLRVQGCRLAAICDLRPERVAAMQRVVEKSGQPAPAAYDRGESDYLRLCDRGDLDLVAIATPWNLHARMCVAALRAGKHAATETPPAQTIAECWQMVEAAE